MPEGAVRWRYTDSNIFGLALLALLDDERQAYNIHMFSPHPQGETDEQVDLQVA